MSPMVTCNRPELPAVFLSHSRLWRTPARQRLSKTCTLASVLVSRWRARFDPIKPAPPKISTDRFSCLIIIPASSLSCCQAQAVELSHGFRHAVLRLLGAQPPGQVFHSIRKADPRRVAKKLSCPRNVGKAMPHVSSPI